MSAFSNETRRQSLELIVRGQRKLIRARYEKGLLILKEDFVRLPHGQVVNLQIQIINDLLGILKNDPRKKRANGSE